MQTIKADFLILHDYCPKNKNKNVSPKLFMRAVSGGFQEVVNYY